MVRPRRDVAYKSVTNFADLIFYSKEIRITLNLRSGKLNDPKGIATDFTKPPKGYWGNGDYEVIVRGIDEIPYAISLIEQSYRESKQ